MSGDFNPPDYELQRALVGALSADAPLKGLIGDPARVYDSVPPGASFPYVSWGDDQTLPDEADCIEGSEIFVTLHVWSRADASRPEAKQILGAIRACLYEAFAADALVLPSHRLVEFALGTPGAQVMRDPDGSTAHGVITFRALTEPI